MTVFRAATLRTFFFAFRAGAKESKAFLFYNKVENFFVGDIVLLVIEFFAVFSAKQK